MVSFSRSSLLLALVVGPQQVLASCDPPTSPSDASYGYAATPDNSAVIADANKAAVRPFFSDHGCKTISGGGSGSCILGYECQYPGTESLVHVTGWSIDNFFNLAACTPGSKCID